MIPKIIHYCWFGGNPLPENIKKNIESWKKFCPDYRIIEWNENNYNINKNDYTKAAYESKKFAFLTDYVRLDVVYEYGGIYFDTDVELIKPLTNIIESGPFMALEQRGRVNTGIGFGSYSKNNIIRENKKYYEDNNFLDNNGNFKGEVCVKVTVETLLKYGFDYKNNELQKVEDITVYPVEYFSPIKMGTNFIEVTGNTVAIHHYEASWYTGNKKIKKLKYLLIPIKQFIKYQVFRRKPYE